MKKIAFFAIFSAALSTFSSCEQDSLNPLPVQVKGSYVLLDLKQASLEFDNFETTAFRATLSNPSNNIARYELYVRRIDNNGFATGDYKLLKTITAFPHELNITPYDLANALEIQPTDLRVSDVYRFNAYSYDASGNRTTYNDLSAILRTTPTMKQGYRWSADAKTVIVPPPVGIPYNIYTPFTNL